VAGKVAAQASGIITFREIDVPTSATAKKTVYLNGIVVGQVKATGEHEKDMRTALQFLKENGLHQETTPVQAMFRQALSFATTAAHLHKTDFLKAPRNGFSIAPFVVNGASVSNRFTTNH
jgi:hypothetical protein